MSLLPREHGAYVQLGIALAAGLALAPVSLRAWSQALATILVFFASEPFLVLLGRRGKAAQNQAAIPARRHLIIYGCLLLPMLSLSWVGATMRQGLSILPSLGLGLGLLVLFLIRRERSAPGELLGAAAFSFAALPVATLGGTDSRKALLLTLTLTALNGLGTTLVRGLLSSMKQNGARVPRTLPVWVGLGLTLGPLLSPLPSHLALAPVPLTTVALWVLLAPPSLKDLRNLGWVLAAGSALGAGILLIVLR